MHLYPQPSAKQCNFAPIITSMDQSKELHVIPVDCAKIAVNHTTLLDATDCNVVGITIFVNVPINTNFNKRLRIRFDVHCSFILHEFLGLFFSIKVLCLNQTSNSDVFYPCHINGLGIIHDPWYGHICL